MSIKKRQMPSLTGIRFFLAMWVVVYHQTGTDWVWFQQLDLSQPAMSMLRTGYSAVSLFFILSGFVLAYNYDLGARWTKRERLRFVIARFSRIYPAYFLGLLCVAPLMAYRMTQKLSSGEAGFEAFAGLLNFLLLQSWLPQTALSWNDPGWSLSNEAFFYLCFPFLGVLLWRICTPRGFIAGMAGLWVLSLLAPTWAIWRQVPGFGDVTAVTTAIEVAANPTVSLWADFVKYNPLIRLAEFGAGILLCRVFSWLQANGTRLNGRGYWFYLPGLALTLLLTASAHLIPFPFFHNGLLMPLYLCIILGFAFSGGLVADWLSNPVVVFLGNASYSMYILHVPIYGWLSILWRRLLSQETSGPVWQAVYVFVVVAASALAFKFVEEPMHYWLKRKLNQRLDSSSRTAVVA